MANELHQVTFDLSRAYLQQGQQRTVSFDLQRKQARLELSLTPAEGWPGKNEGERKIAHDKALQANPEWVTLDESLFQVHQELEKTNAMLAALQAEMDGYKWIIRNETNVVLGGASLYDLVHDAVLMQEQETLQTETQEAAENDPAEQAEEEEKQLIEEADSDGVDLPGASDDVLF